MDRRSTSSSSCVDVRHARERVGGQRVPLAVDLQERVAQPTWRMPPSTLIGPAASSNVRSVFCAFLSTGPVSVSEIGFDRNTPSVGSFGEPLIVAVSFSETFCGPCAPTFVLIDESTACALPSPALAVEVVAPPVVADEGELLPPQAATVSASAAASRRVVAERRSMSLLGFRGESRRNGVRRISIGRILERASAACGRSAARWRPWRRRAVSAGPPRRVWVDLTNSPARARARADRAAAARGRARGRGDGARLRADDRAGRAPRARRVELGHHGGAGRLGRARALGTRSLAAYRFARGRGLRRRRRARLERPADRRARARHPRRRHVRLRVGAAPAHRRLPALAPRARARRDPARAAAPLRRRRGEAASLPGAEGGVLPLRVRARSRRADRARRRRLAARRGRAHAARARALPPRRRRRVRRGRRPAGSRPGRARDRAAAHPRAGRARARARAPVADRRARARRRRAEPDRRRPTSSCRPAAR